MLPFIIGGGVILGAGFIAAIKEKCSVCDSYFTINENCFLCGKYVCGGCGTTIELLGRICAQKHGDIHKAIQESSTVKVYSENYKGKVPLPKFSKKIETGYYRNKDDAEKALKFIAAISGAKLVQGVHQSREIGQDGNYKFSIWAYSGTI